MFVTSDGVVKEKGDSKQKPCSQKPGEGHDKKRVKLVLALATNLVNQLFKWSKLKGVVFGIVLS